MAISIHGDLSTREGFIAAIEQAGRYIADHAESLLGDYPSGLNELTITAVFDFASPPCIDVKRRHFVLPPDKYPAQAPKKQRRPWRDEEPCCKEDGTPGILPRDGRYA